RLSYSEDCTLKNVESLCVPLFCRLFDVFPGNCIRRAARDPQYCLTLVWETPGSDSGQTTDSPSGRDVFKKRVTDRNAVESCRSCAPTESQMPNLRRPASHTAVDLAVEDEAAADAAADGDVEDRRQPLARAVQRLGEAGDVGVVAERGGQARHVGDPVGQRE